MTLNPIITTDVSLPSTRDASPSPSISPTPALSACPPLDRSFSATSSASTFSRLSTPSRSSSASTAVRQRGYVRPQGATFAASARNRDSVLSLGSIAHLQYYFARTGLLDGKGGQLAKEKKNKPEFADSLSVAAPQNYASSDASSFGDDITISPAEEYDPAQDWNDNMMLPPTVSTYSHRVQYIPPPPDSETLRNDLKKSLLDAEKALEEVRGQNAQELHMRGDISGDNTEDDTSQEPSGWHEIQGLHVLDVVTLAIRAAKIYYTTHEHPKRLYSIKSERQIREELLGVLDVLKRMGSRNFAGGIRDEELKTMHAWVKGIKSFIEEEKALEQQESRDREKWKWLDGTWSGREREREWLFLSSFLSEGVLPEWTNAAVGQGSTPFLEAMRTGLTLVTIQNAILRKSKRQFGEIKSFHTDTAKPYRCTENLRYWIKSAEIRWETKLAVDVTGVIHGKDEAWASFDAAILQWSRAAREGLTQEWREGSVCAPVSNSYPDFQETPPLT